MCLLKFSEFYFIAAEAAVRVMRYGFGELELNRIEARYIIGNDASRRVMEKSGMKYSHTSEKELTYLDKERDLIYYVIEKGEPTMEKQIVTITIKTKGDVCQMSDAEIKAWYEEKVASLFDPAYGTPEIDVKLERKKN